MQILVVNPFAFLQTAIIKSEDFAAFLYNILRDSSYVFSICLYSDEISPGMVLAARVPRKTQAIYWSVMEFGQPCLSREDAWFPMSTTRSAEVNKLSGGMAQMIKICLQQFLGDGKDSTMHDLRKGIVLVFPGGESVCVTGDFAAFINDERGHKFASSNKGSGGIKPCGLCANCYNFRFRTFPDPSGFAVSSASPFFKEFKLYKDHELRALVRRLKRATEIADPKLNMMKEQYGYNYEPDGFMSDDHLNVRLASVWLYDWMHTLLIEGVFCKELRACIAKLTEDGNGYGIATFRKCLHSFTTPQRIASGSRLCDKNPPDGTASEWLSAVPVIRKLCLDFLINLAPDCEGALRSLVACCDVVIALSAGETSRTTPEKLASLIEDYLVLHLAEYMESQFIPKHHYLLHLVGNLNAWAFLLSTFVHERKHRLVKRHAGNKQSMKNMSRNLLEDVVLECLWDLEADGLATVTLEIAKPVSEHLLSLFRVMHPHSLGPVETSLEVRINERRIHRNDVIAFTESSELCIGKLMAHARCGRDTIVVIEQWEIVGRRASGTLRCMVRTGTAIALDMPAVIEPLTHGEVKPDAICEVIVPVALLDLVK